MSWVYYTHSFTEYHLLEYLSLLQFTGWGNANSRSHKIENGQIIENLSKHQKLKEVLHKTDNRDISDGYEASDTNKTTAKLSFPHRSKRAASYSGYSRYSAEPYGVGGYSRRKSYSPVSRYSYSSRPSYNRPRSYKGTNSYYAAPPSSGGRMSGGRTYYSPQTSYGGRSSSYGGGQPAYGGGVSYGNTAYQGGAYTGAYGGNYASAPSTYAGGGYGTGAYGAGSYANPAYNAQSGAYTDPNDPYSGYPDEALTKYLEDILKKSTDESDSESEDRSRNASPESREASNENSDESENSRESKDKSSDESSKSKKRSKKNKKKKKKYKSKNKRTRKRGSKSESESESSESYDYSEEDLPILTHDPKPLVTPKVPLITQAPAWFGTTSTPPNKALGLNKVVSQDQASLIFNNLLGNLLKNAMENQQNDGPAVGTTPAPTTPTPPVYVSEPTHVPEQQIGQELAELGFLIKTTFRKMASRLDNLKMKQETFKRLKEDDTPKKELFENSRGNAYESLPDIVPDLSRRSVRSTMKKNIFPTSSSYKSGSSSKTGQRKYIKDMHGASRTSFNKLQPLDLNRATTSPGSLTPDILGWVIR